MNPTNSRVEGRVFVRTDSPMTRRMFCISQAATTGPAGPFDIALSIKDYPIVSKILPAIPMPKR